MFPFRSALNWPLLLACVTNVCLFDADGFFPPPFTHSYVTDWVALHETVSPEPDSSPASLNWHTRLDPLSEAEVAFLMKCAFPAMAEGATKAATASAPARTAVIFLILMKTSFRAAGVLRLRSSVPRIASPLTQSNLPGASARCQRLSPELPRAPLLAAGRRGRLSRRVALADLRAGIAVPTALVTRSERRIAERGRCRHRQR